MDGRVGGQVRAYERDSRGAHAHTWRAYTPRPARTQIGALRWLLAVRARVGRRDDVMLEGKEQHRR